MHVYFHLNLKNSEDRNAWNLCIEIFWAAILSSAVTYAAAFAIRLGATDFQIGLFNALPALLGVLIALPAGRFLQASRQRKRWIFGSLALNRAGYIVVALIPWLHLAQGTQGLLVVAALVLLSVPGNFFNVGFIALQGEIIPEDKRAAVITARNMIFNGTLTVCVFLMGLWLDRAAFPGNYQWMFLAGFAASMLSQYHLSKLEFPATPAQPAGAGAPASRSFFQQLAGMRSALRAQPEFARLTANTLIYGLGLWAAAPLYMLYYVNNLGASNFWIGLQGAIASVTTIAGYALWRRQMRRWGEPLTLRRTIVLMGLFPLLLGLAPNLTLILFIVALNGLLSPGMGLSHFNTLLKVTPEERRAEYTALYITITNLGVFVCPLVGVALAQQIGMIPTLVGCGLASILGGLAFWAWPVQRPAEPREQPGGPTLGTAHSPGGR